MNGNITSNFRILTSCILIPMICNSDSDYVICQCIICWYDQIVTTVVRLQCVFVTNSSMSVFANDSVLFNSIILSLLAIVFSFQNCTVSLTVIAFARKYYDRICWLVCSFVCYVRCAIAKSSSRVFTKFVMDV